MEKLTKLQLTKHSACSWQNVETKSNWFRTFQLLIHVYVCLTKLRKMVSALSSENCVGREHIRWFQKS